MFLCLTLIVSREVIADFEEIVVTASKSEKTIGETAGSVSILDEADLSRISHVHINELLQRVPGVWISRGNGQEHLTAVRSPVLTGAGSCGAFLIAQDGISLRAPGFCNVNQLFESTSEIAERVEVFRGPNSSIYGSNAVHGVINIITPEPGTEKKELFLEGGPDDFYKAKLTLSTENFRMDFSGSHDGGYKENSGYGQQKLLLKHKKNSGSFSIKTTFSMTNLNQETAGFINGIDAYKESDLKRENPNPEAFRDASSLRLVSDISRETKFGALTLKPYLRSIDMEFLQHFLPGQPEEKNGHDSAGISIVLQSNSWWEIGAEVEYTDGFLEETQATPVQGSAFLSATLARGRHYDYDVTSSLAGVFIKSDYSLSDKALLSGSLRYQHTKYEYDNQMIDGRTRDDGTPCGFGGCRFSRPADRDDSFETWSPSLGFIYKVRPDMQIFASVSRGFRAPQTTELYRLQNNQIVADIDEVELDSFEIGLRSQNIKNNYDVTLFSMEKDNFIFRDTRRQNVDNGETSHRGIEINGRYQINTELEASLSFTYAEHEYDNNPGISRNNIAGNLIDTAPKTLGSARLLWKPRDNFDMELEWVHIGSYFQDPENQNKYDGHDLFHLRGQIRVSKRSTIFIHLKNLTDKNYAERADFAFGSHRYFVGTPRSPFIGFKRSF